MTARLAAVTVTTLLPVALAGCGGTQQPVKREPCLAAQVTAGVNTTWVLKPDNSAWYWGYGWPGQSIPSDLPAAAWPSLPPDTTELRMRSNIVCALSSNGDLRCQAGPSLGCCSYTASGQFACSCGKPNAQTTALAGVVRVKMGVSSNGNLNDPVAQPDVATNFAITTDSTLWEVWYTEDDPGRSTFSQVTALGNDVLTASAGWLQRCAVKTDGTVWCWGRGYLGDGTDAYPSTDPEQPPVSVTLPLPAVDVVAAWSATEVVLADGSVWHWGDTGFGIATTPTATGVSDVKMLVAGAFHHCALKNDGSAWCWGRNDVGEAGVEPGGPGWQTPRQVTSLGNDVTQLAAGEMHTCARKSDATIWCWGHGGWGQLGGNKSVNPTPIQMMGCQ
jgi:hypothetical protein